MIISGVEDGRSERSELSLARAQAFYIFQDTLHRTYLSLWSDLDERAHPPMGTVTVCYLFHPNLPHH